MFTPNALRSMTGQTFGHGAFQAHAPEIEPHPFAEVSEFVHGRPIDRNIIARTHPERAIRQAWPELMAYLTNTNHRDVFYGYDNDRGYRQDFLERFRLSDSPLASAAFRHTLLNFGYYPEGIEGASAQANFARAADEVCAEFLQHMIPEERPYSFIRGYFSNHGPFVSSHSMSKILEDPFETSVFFNFLYHFISPEWPAGVRIYALTICQKIIREHYGPNKKVMSPELKDLAYDVCTKVFVFDPNLWVAYLSYDCLQVLYAGQSFEWEFDATDLLSERCEILMTGQETSSKRRYYQPTRDKHRAMDELLNRYLINSNSVSRESLDILQITPLHCLADDNPDLDQRIDIKKEKSKILRGLIDQFGYDKDIVLHHFFFKGQNLAVIRIEETGHNILVQGHHRLAALIEAVQEGWIPSDWLKAVPVEVYKHKYQQGSLKMHGEILLHFLIGGPKPLSWKDVLGKSLVGQD